MNRIQSAMPMSATGLIQPVPTTRGVQSTLGTQFQALVQNVSDTQTRADSLAGQMALGDARSMHAVMVASDEASLQLSAVLQVRSKALEAYQEVMRMQV